MCLKIVAPFFKFALLSLYLFCVSVQVAEVKKTINVTGGNTSAAVEKVRLMQLQLEQEKQERSTMLVDDINAPSGKKSTLVPPVRKTPTPVTASERPTLVGGISVSSHKRVDSSGRIGGLSGEVHKGPTHAQGHAGGINSHVVKAKEDRFGASNNKTHNNNNSGIQNKNNNTNTNNNTKNNNNINSNNRLAVKHEQLVGASKTNTNNITTGYTGSVPAPNASLSVNANNAGVKSNGRPLSQYGHSNAETNAGSNVNVSSNNSTNNTFDINRNAHVDANPKKRALKIEIPSPAREGSTQMLNMVCMGARERMCVRVCAFMCACVYVSE
jgi:hypothetical protein